MAIFDHKIYFIFSLFFLEYNEINSKFAGMDDKIYYKIVCKKLYIPCFNKFMMLKCVLLKEEVKYLILVGIFALVSQLNETHEHC